MSSNDFQSFVKEVMEKNGYVVLCREDIEEIQKSAFPENHIIAMKYADKHKSLIIIRGDYKTIKVPTYNIPILSAKTPDFSRFKLEDLGLTINFGDYSLSSTVLTDL